MFGVFSPTQPHSHNNPDNTFFWLYKSVIILTYLTSSQNIKKLNLSDSGQEKEQLLKMNECSCYSAEPNEQILHSHVNESGLYLSDACIKSKILLLLRLFFVLITRSALKRSDMRRGTIHVHFLPSFTVVWSPLNQKEKETPPSLSCIQLTSITWFSPNQ